LAILLFFFNLLWSVYLFGAELTSAYADRVRPVTSRSATPAAAASRIENPSSPGGVVWAFAAGLVIGGFRGRRR
jgi:hypothetical protein